MSTSKDIECNEKVPRKNAFIFLIVDNSIGVSDVAIQMFNIAINDLIQLLSDIPENSDKEIKLVVIAFNEKCSILTKATPDCLEQTSIDKIIPSGKPPNFTNMLSVLNGLIRDYCNKAFTQGPFYAPVYIFLTPGPSNLMHIEALNILKKNRVFQYGTKIACAIGENPNIKEIVDIVGNEESVISNSNLDLFRRLFRFIEVLGDPMMV